MRTLFRGWGWLAAAALLWLAACGGTPAAPGAAATRIQLANGSYTNITPAQLQAMFAQKDFVLINVHVPYEGEIERTDAFVPYTEIGTGIKQYAADPKAKVVLYCRSGRMSQIAAETLVGQGYTNVWNLDGGMIAWQQAGLPLLDKK